MNLMHIGRPPLRSYLTAGRGKAYTQIDYEMLQILSIAATMEEDSFMRKKFVSYIFCNDRCLILDWIVSSVSIT